jgi:hypothetical protein
MAFKLVLTAALFDALSDAHKALYKKNETTGEYLLDVDPADLPDVTGLKKKTEELLAEKKEEQRKREEAERERAKKDGDITALESSWQTRLETETGGLKTKVSKRDQQLARLTVGRAATEMAAELAIAGSAKALLPHIERRLKMELNEETDEVTIRVLNAAGQPSAMTLDQLKDEFRHDSAFAPLIVASKANGSGADGGKNKGGGAANGKSFDEMTEAERIELNKKNPVEFRRLKDDHRKAQRAARG